ncbi:hypothetical protein [Dyella sp. M7H15-1]|uniref:hypothetical protein n=1 Tax=Dyella sp. M7H15-1 TaxID=2501295 RepID=UPI0013E8D15B|nr:hypothetical protein [Dyella sp. M7H15-1]
MKTQHTNAGGQSCALHHFSLAAAKGKERRKSFDDTHILILLINDIQIIIMDGMSFS